MRFLPAKRRGPPSVIIVSLIDVLLVVLIFMMVSTTFKQQPAIQLALPEASQSSPGRDDAGDRLLVTVAREEPRIYLGTQPISLERLRDELKASFGRNSRVGLSIRADREAPWGEVVRIMDAAKEAGIRDVNAQITSKKAEP